MLYMCGQHCLEECLLRPSLCSPEHEDGHDPNFPHVPPVQRVIRVVRGLWCQNNVFVSSCAVLEVSCRMLGTLLPLSLSEMDGSWNVREHAVFEDTERHDCNK